MLKATLITIFFFSLTTGILSQECFEYHKTSCFSKASKFSYVENTASVSFEFASGEVRELPFTLINGIDYRITLCAQPEFENVIQFVIKTLEGKEMYNNSKHNFNLNLEFASRKTQDVILELKAPDSKVADNDTISFEGCIGVLIEEMVSVKTGF